MSLTQRDGVINTQTNCWTKQGQWGQGGAVNTIPEVSLPGLRRRRKIQQLTALSHKKHINLQGFFHCQLSAVLLPAPSVAKVKWYHAFLFWSGSFLFLYSIICQADSACLAWWQEHGAGAQPRAVCCQRLTWRAAYWLHAEKYHCPSQLPPAPKC